MLLMYLLDEIVFVGWEFAVGIIEEECILEFLALNIGLIQFVLVVEMLKVVPK